MLLTLIKQYWNVSVFRQLPAMTPYSKVLLGAFAVLFYVVVVTQWNMVEVKNPMTFRESLLSGFFLVFSYTLYTFAVLNLRQLSNRFVQTLTCLFATHTIIHVVAYPLLVGTTLLTEEAISRPFMTLFLMGYLLLTIGVTIWQLMITITIYKTALDVDNLRAILTTIGLFAVNFLIISIVR